MPLKRRVARKVVKSPTSRIPKPMPIGKAVLIAGRVTQDYVKARTAVDRQTTYQAYHYMQHAFRHTYGDKAWNDLEDWVRDELGLEDPTIDNQILRDS